MSTTFHRTGFTWLAYFLLAFYGYFLNILGPITPYLKDELQLSYTVSSLHFTAFAVGILLVGVGGHWVIERLGRSRALWLGSFGVSAGALLLVAGRQSWVTIGAAFFMGFVGSLILAIIPSALADEQGAFRAVALSEANVIASLVSAMAPLMVGWLAPAPGGWRMALVLAALLPLLLLAVFRRTSAPTPAVAEVDQGDKPLPRLFWVYWIALVLAVSAEFCMISWSADYLEKDLLLAKSQAAQAVSLFLGGMILGRLASSRLVQRFSTHAVVITSILFAGVGFALYWSGGSVFLALAGLFLTGLGIASLYPLILSLAIGTAGSSTVQASARATLASGTAILALPFILGRLADSYNIHQAYSIVGILLAAVLLILLATLKPALARSKRSLT